METVRVTTSQNIDIDYEVAGLGERIVARIIDIGLFILIFVLAVLVIITAHITVSDFNTGVLLVIYGALYVFYDLICEAFIGGQSIGKRIMKIKVISLDGGQPTLGQFLLRWVFRIVDFSLTGELGALITVAVTQKHQRIGDLVAGTTLIKTEQRIKMSHIAFMPSADDYEPLFPIASQLSAKDVALIQDVINTYMQTRNPTIVYNMAVRIREHLGVAQPADMNDLVFLKTIVKDYGRMAVQADSI